MSSERFRNCGSLACAGVIGCAGVPLAAVLFSGSVSLYESREQV